jgi:hypothetical protein
MYPHWRRIIYNKAMENNLIRRLGTFFILIGLVLLLLFTGSVLSKDFQYIYLFLSAAALFLGFLFHRAAPRQESNRFAGVRKIRQRSRERREEKQKEKAPK